MSSWLVVILQIVKYDKKDKGVRATCSSTSLRIYAVLSPSCANVRHWLLFLAIDITQYVVAMD
jgi:hypothetical protein